MAFGYSASTQQALTKVYPMVGDYKAKGVTDAVAVATLASRGFPSQALEVALATKLPPNLIAAVAAQAGGQTATSIWTGGLPPVEAPKWDSYLKYIPWLVGGFIVLQILPLFRRK